MRAILVILVVIVIAAIAAIQFHFIDVSQTRPGALPKIAVTGGSAPAFDVKTANVSVGSEKHVVETPTIDVKKPQ